MILAGPERPLRDMLRANSALAARFPAVINFPGYTARQLATLADEAGFTLTPDAAREAAIVLAQSEVGRGAGNARLAVQLLDEVTVRQACRITTGPKPRDPATLSTIDAADVPEHIHPPGPPADD